MNEITLNQTPLRTSRNFGINNIKLEDLQIPNNFPKFENITIYRDVDVSLICPPEQPSEIYEKSKIEKLKYGAGEILEDNILNNANSIMKILTYKKDNIKIIYEFDDDNKNLAGYIDVQAEADLNLIIEYKSKTDEKCFCNNILKVKADKNVTINVTIINFTNNLTDVFESIENEVHNDSNIKFTIIDLGGYRRIVNYYSNVIGDKSNSTLKNIYLGSNSELIDLNYIAEIKGKNSQVDIDVQGALKDECKKNFKGTIDFKKGCIKAKGSENEYCLLLTDKAKSIALPMLLCTEEDVEGEHSTASGKVDSDKLFYLMSRGLSKEEATKLIVKAGFNKIIEAIEDEDIKHEIYEEIDRKLD